MKRFTNPKAQQDVRILLSTDHGSWIALTEGEWKHLLKYEIPEELFKSLEEKGIIFTKNNLNAILGDYLLRYGYLYRGTTLHIILPTLRCNKKCIYCHSSVKESSDKSYDMSLATAKKTLDFIFQTPSPNLTIEFQGGEAFLNFDVLMYIVKEAKMMAKEKSKELKFDLVTNLTLINDNFINWIKEEKINVCTSIDGPKEIHNKHRRFENGYPTYNIVKKNFMRLNDAGIKVGSLMVTTRNSLPYWKEIIDEYVSIGLPEIQLKFLNRLGFAAHAWDKQEYSIYEFIEFWKKSVEYMLKLNNNGKKIKERYATLILRKILNKYDPGMLDFRSPCGIVIGQLAYNFNGDIYSCDEGRNYEIFNLGNVYNSSYEQVLSSLQARQLVSASLIDNLLCDNCAYKPWCGTCIVMNYAEEGSIIPKIPMNSHHLLFEMMFDYIFEKLLFDEESQKVLLSWLK